MKDPVLIDELRHDQATGLTVEQEVEISSFLFQAKQELLNGKFNKDNDPFICWLLDNSNLIKYFYLSIQNMNIKPTIGNISIDDVRIHAETWLNIVDLIDLSAQNDVREKAEELWWERR